MLFVSRIALYLPMPPLTSVFVVIGVLAAYSTS